MVRDAFAGVALGDGVGLREARGKDDYADKATLAALRALDEKHDWSTISVKDLDCYGFSSLSFFDADGMKFHLPAYLVANLEGRLRTDCLDFHLVCLPPDETRFDTLSISQRKAVREYLLLRQSDLRGEIDHPLYPLIEEALRTYWTDAKSA